VLAVAVTELLWVAHLRLPLSVAVETYKLCRQPGPARTHASAMLTQPIEMPNTQAHTASSCPRHRLLSAAHRLTQMSAPTISSIGGASPVSSFTYQTRRPPQVAAACFVIRVVIY
jgi:hypothetical protein